jgi:hypothetical protein
MRRVPRLLYSRRLKHIQYFEQQCSLQLTDHHWRHWIIRRRVFGEVEEIIGPVSLGDMYILFMNGIVGGDPRRREDDGLDAVVLADSVKERRGHIP